MPHASANFLEDILISTPQSSTTAGRVTELGRENATATAPKSTHTAALAMMTTLFFMWGFLTVLNDVLVPHLKAVFDLNYAQVMLIQFAFFSAYLLFSIPSGRLIDWIGYKRSMVVGLFTMAAGAFLFIAAASVPSFNIFLAALMVLAAGITVLQVAANPYVAVLGPSQRASSRLNFAQALNSLGTTLAPYFGGMFILSALPKTMEEVRQLSPAALEAYRLQEAASVKLPYAGLGIALVALGVAIAMFKLPPIPGAQRHGTGALPDVTAKVWHYPHLTLGALAIFLYVGAEVSIGSFLVNYFNQPEIGNLPHQVGARFVSLYWFGAMVGRFAGSAILRRVGAGTLLGIAATGACLLVLTSTFTMGPIAMWSIILVGFFNSIMFPNIFTLAISGLGRLTGAASGILVTAIVGGAIIPVLQGALADRIGIHHAFLLPAACYVYIIFYALKGSRLTTPSTAR
ncbi:MAG: sugar MFS transporter [Acidobacteriales bacterium]|nr:sugar MFS transporter [Terriglobales bacterium]